MPSKINPNITKYYIIKYNKKDVLHLSTIDDINNFCKKYKINNMTINWQNVAKDYKGIDISPYNKKLTLDKKYLWYNTWDCSSQCIWDFSAIKECKEININNKK